ncbi:MAG: MgtC/SapB family protein [Deltaproteobacteria bacterium]|nr:MgtC/SapB family protein [Deltaproteobacteria bacterium]
MWDWQHVYWDMAKLVITAVVGGTIGFEREAHGQAAGLRTYILVSVGACLMMMLSMEMEHFYRHLSVDQSVVRLDPARIASYAIASMGFLGAGAIITGKGTVRGLTTAAGLWLVTGIGLAIGAGYLLPAIFATLVSLLILYGLRQLKKVFTHDEHTVMTLKFDGTTRPMDRIREILEGNEVNIQFINYKIELPSNATTFRLRLESKDDLYWGHIVKCLSDTKGLQEISWEEGEVT